MKKWFIILTIIFFTGCISSATLAGRIFYKELKTYEDYDKKDLQVQALENIFVDSDVPVEIHPTTQAPYVEFSQSFIDLVGIAPEYQLEVQEKGNSTYINLNKIEDVLIWLGVKENKAKLNLYLPEGDINKLKVEAYGNDIRNEHRSTINLDKINVKDVDIDTYHTDIILDGAYEKVNIQADSNSLNMKSTIETTLYTTGRMEQNLSGKFKKISIEGNHEAINIDSTNISSVEIENYYGSINLTGQYELISLKGEGNDIDLSSQVECKLITEGQANRIHANGPFKAITLEEGGSEIEVQTTIVPKKITMLEEARQSNLILTLPSNIPGFILRYVDEEYNEYAYYDDLGYMDDEYIRAEQSKNDIKNVKSEFEPINETNKNGQLIYQYGNGDTCILLNRNSGLTLELIDGGYSSVIE
ncbi:MAG: hypothetical protein E7231_13230 [Cellulosilyticum sp.]|nr:hypothetical protein [Cellulosilyticum sp.]